MIAGDAALFGVKVREFHRIRQSFVKYDDGRIGQWRSGANLERDGEQKEKVRSTIHLQTEFETVVGDMSAFWKPRFGRLRQLMRNVREISFAWLHTPRHVQRLIHIKMGGVRFFPRSINPKSFYARHKIDNLLR